MASYDSVMLVDQDGNYEPEGFDAAGNLPDLRLAMLAWIVRIGTKSTPRHVGNIQPCRRVSLLHVTRPKFENQRSVFLIGPVSSAGFTKLRFFHRLAGTGKAVLEPRTRCRL